MTKKIVDLELLKKLFEESSRNSRKRINYNLHTSFNDPIQRFLNVGQPSTYVRPHKHANMLDIELFCLLTGEAVVVIYDDNGKVDDHFVLDRNHNYIVEISPIQWHSFIILKKNTALLEIRRGPYCKSNKIFAPWSPPENSKEAQEFIYKIKKQILD